MFFTPDCSTAAADLTEQHLIVAHGVTNSGSDPAQLTNMAKRAMAVLKSETLEAVANRGYLGSPEILACRQAGITVNLPKPQTSGAQIAMYDRAAAADYEMGA